MRGGWYTLVYTQVLAPALFLLTLFGVLARPWRIGPATAAGIGAVLALATGVVGWRDVLTVAAIVWNATFALIAIMIISALLDEAGFFRWAAYYMVRWAGENGRRLFAAVILLGAVVSSLFTNDATVLILTPIVYELLAALDYGPDAMLPFLMACGFVADAMSIPLVVSNLTNIITVDFFARAGHPIGFARFAGLMLPAALFSLLATLAVLIWYYRKEIRSPAPGSTAPDPRTAISEPVLFRTGAWVLTAMVVAFFLNQVVRVPVSLVMATGAAVLLLVAWRRGTVSTAAVLRRAPWHVIAFSLGMYLVVFGLANAGLTAWSSALLTRLSGYGLLPAVFGAGILVALFSAAMNNLPGVMVGCLSIAAAAGTHHEAMAFANVIGAGIGPKLTPIGSLATLIWLHYLQHKGVHINWRYYLRVGLIITPPVLLAALLGLTLTLRLTGG